MEIQVFVGINGCGKTRKLEDIFVEEYVNKEKKAVFLSRPFSTTQDCLDAIKTHDVVIIDNAEDRLHPVLQMEFVNNILEAAKKHDTSVYCATHSPYFLDPLEVESVFSYVESRKAFRCLTEHPDTPKIKGSLSPGEMWSCIGLDEDW